MESILFGTVTHLEVWNVLKNVERFSCKISGSSGSEKSTGVSDVDQVIEKQEVRPEGSLQRFRRNRCSIKSLARAESNE